ncbi:MAG TPA: hypothetical protein PLL10_04475 [Elusimicrobiales bacterium]|nr:hypothetical protein [Elusimicrobiales bacterium]
MRSATLFALIGLLAAAPARCEEPVAAALPQACAGEPVKAVLSAPVPAEDDFKFPFKVGYTVTPEMRRALKADLQFIASLRGDSETDLHLKILGRVHGDDYLAFLAKRIHYVSMGGGRDASVVAHANSHVLTYNKPGNLHPFDEPQLSRVDTLFHEARHAEAFRAWPHIKCPVPFLDEDGEEILTVTDKPLGGRYACDSSPLGAYGTGAVVLGNLARFCTNCNGKVLEDAELYARVYAWRVTDPQGRRQLQEDLFP